MQRAFLDYVGAERWTTLAEVKIRFSGCAVKCPGTSNFARSLAVLSGHVHRTRPSISQSVWSLLQNCIHNNVLAM